MLVPIPISFAPETIIFPENVETPEIFTSPSTSRVPFASMAPVNVETPAIKTLSKSVWRRTSRVSSIWTCPSLAIINLSLLWVSDLTLNWLPPPLIEKSGLWSVSVKTSDGLALLIVSPLLPSTVKFPSPPSSFTAFENVETPVTLNVPVVVPPETNTPSLVVASRSLLFWYNFVDPVEPGTAVIIVALSPAFLTCKVLVNNFKLPVPWSDIKLWSPEW